LGINFEFPSEHTFPFILNTDRLTAANREHAGAWRAGVPEQTEVRQPKSVLFAKGIRRNP
jgi:hypothetical protein